MVTRLIRLTVVVIVLVVVGIVAVIAFRHLPMTPNLERPPEREPDIEFPVPSWYSFGAFFSPDGKQFVVYGGEKEWGRIDFWDFETKTKIRSIDLHIHVRGAVFTPDQAKVIAITGDRNICIFGGQDWKLERTIYTDRIWNDDIAILPDGERFVTAGVHKLTVWKIRGSEVVTLKSKVQLISLLLSKDCKHLAVYDGLLTEIWDTEQLTVANRYPTSEGKAFVGLSFSPDEKWVARGWTERKKNSTKDKGVVTIWNRETFEEKTTLDAGFNEPDLLKFTNDGKLLVCCTISHSGTDGHVIHPKLLFWNVKTGKLVYVSQPYGGGVPILELSPDDRWIATRGEGDMIRLWDLRKIRHEIGEQIQDD